MKRIKKQFKVHKATICKVYENGTMSVKLIVRWIPTKHNHLGTEYSVTYVCGSEDEAFRLIEKFKHKTPK